MVHATKAQAAIYVGYFIILCISIFGYDGMGLYRGCSMMQRLGYPLFHQNVFHALVNVFVLNQCLKAVPCRYNIIVFYAIAISYPFASSVPIIGLSGLVYAYMGYIAPFVSKKIKYNLTILIYIGIGFVFSCMAIGVHIYCYVLGLLWGYLNAPLCQDK